RHRFFNTNNLWVNLKALSAALAESPDHGLELPMIRNEKRLDPTDPDSPAVFQLESAMGAAISSFENARAVIVPRSRFLPVKKTNDLILLRSDCYRLTDDFAVTDDRAESDGPCIVELDPKYYGTVDEFDARFADGVPSLLKCASLSIAGDVAFGADVRCTGEVSIRNTSATQARITDGSHLEGVIEL
ncbi:MAG: UTP--glucose-1-phosphate uridylyltransferase, partial [Gammaproteobacteria bacterium]